MARQIEKLTALKVRKTQAPGRYNDGAGLYLLIKPSGAKTWLFRYRDLATAKLRDKGIGASWEVDLAGARAKAKTLREQLRSGVDPIDATRDARALKKADQARAVSFKFCAEAYIKAHASGWKNKKSAAQWTATLEAYAYPTIGALPVAAIDTDQIVSILSKIWTDKTETASRLRGRMERILAWATTSGYREGENPARWRNHLDTLLPMPNKVRTVKHHAALPWSEIGPFMVKLRAQAGSAARALELAILTATRSGEVRMAKWDELDLKASMWIIPATRMKAGKEHRVPLPDAAIKLLAGLDESDGPVFPGKGGKPLSDMALTALLRRMEYNVTAHGFRSTFRDWAGEASNFPREVIEHALAHQLKDRAEAAYARGDLLAKRWLLMQAWANQCEKAKGATNVTPIARASSSKSE